MTNLTNICTPIALVVVLSGCAAAMNPIGEAKFDCNRKQDSKSQYCRSFKAVEASTASDVPASRFDKEFKLSDLDKLTGISPDDPTQPAVSSPRTAMPASAAAPPRAALLPHQVRDAAPLDGMPVRTGPLVQRVWIKRFVDGRDVLTENTVVYREIQGTKWAGIDSNSRALSSQGQAYPHRPSEPQPGTNPSRAPVEVKSPGASLPEFKQPGVPTETQESASVPAVSGTSSMPQ